MEPANRPPELRGADSDLLLPSPEECRARLIQWADDFLQELAEETDRVWSEVEAPQLARRTDPKAIVTETYKEQQLHRASNEYRAMYYKAHSAFEAIRKRKAAEEKEARKNAGRVDLPQSSEDSGPADRTGHAAPATAPEEAPGAQDEPSRAVETPVMTEAPVLVTEAELGARDEPSRVVETPFMAEAPVPVPEEASEAGAQDEPSRAADAVIASSPGVDTPARRSSHQVPGRRRKRSGHGNRGFRRPSALAAQRASPGLRPPSPGGRVEAGAESDQHRDWGTIGGRHPP
jgi:hypothetical protein